jgi:hypothetical protein
VLKCVLDFCNTLFVNKVFPVLCFQNLLLLFIVLVVVVKNVTFF